MSRVGKNPVAVPSGVTVKIAGRDVSVTGPKGTLAWGFPITATVTHDADAKAINVGRTDDRKQSRANHGLTRALIDNMVKGVTDGFERRLKIFGTGYN